LRALPREGFEGQFIGIAEADLVAAAGGDEPALARILGELLNLTATVANDEGRAVDIPLLRTAWKGHAWDQDIVIVGVPPEIAEMARSAEKTFADLYREAFRRFKAEALWNVRESGDPSPADALAITRMLRVEGDLDARQLAEDIEEACRAAL
jgi:hypothetical protein